MPSYIVICPPGTLTLVEDFTLGRMNQFLLEANIILSVEHYVFPKIWHIYSIYTNHGKKEAGTSRAYPIILSGFIYSDEMVIFQEAFYFFPAECLWARRVTCT